MRWLRATSCAESCAICCWVTSFRSMRTLPIARRWPRRVHAPNHCAHCHGARCRVQPSLLPGVSLVTLRVRKRGRVPPPDQALSPGRGRGGGFVAPPPGRGYRGDSLFGSSSARNFSKAHGFNCRPDEGRISPADRQGWEILRRLRKTPRTGGMWGGGRAQNKTFPPSPAGGGGGEGAPRQAFERHNMWGTPPLVTQGTATPRSVGQADARITVFNPAARSRSRASLAARSLTAST